MNLIKCNKGHYYDGDKFPNCPHCAGTVSNNIADNNKTVPLEAAVAPEVCPTEPVTGTEPEVIQSAKVVIPSGEKTVGYYDIEEGIEPVVGWLVCVEGVDIGKSYNLKAGRNFIGRSSTNDVVLSDDNSVSREKHAIVIYDPKSRNFMVQPGMSSELFYVNDEVILQAVPINDRDFISVGKTKLMFVPCCGPDFTWDDYKSE